MKKYEIDLKSSFIDYITQTHKKHFKVALNYAIENNFDCVKVNRTYFNFDFDKLEVNINGDITYKMKEVEE